MTKICLCFGGPSEERNISAGSLKPWVTWLQAAQGIELLVLYFDKDKCAWILPPVYYFTNTCEDFESQLELEARVSESDLDALLQEQDVVVPLIHGEFGEDGELQQRLEQLGVAYVFSGPTALRRTYDKVRCYRHLGTASLPVPKHFSFDAAEWAAEPVELFERARDMRLEKSKLMCAVKPQCGGSSIGVSLVTDDYRTFCAAVQSVLDMGQRVLVEAILLGTEFSVVCLETDAGCMALLPTEVEPGASFYDTRAKYLHGSGARLHTPLRLISRVKSLREAAIISWRALGLRDMARIDGFYDETGLVTITDINGISGMGFSSFGFLQTALAGMGHAELIHGLLGRAAARKGIVLPRSARAVLLEKSRVHLLFGGPTSERQVSRQSGIFVGLCLSALGYEVHFHFMDRSCRFTEVGLFYALHHDVEEIQALIDAPERRAEIATLASQVHGKKSAAHLRVGPTLALREAVAEADFVFLALHGGPGEDGTLQAALEVLGKPYNGPGPECSRLCADKVDTLRRVKDLRIPGVSVPRQREVTDAELLEWTRKAAWHETFNALQRELGSASIVIKPARDGCSTGVKLLANESELRSFVRAVIEMRPSVAAGELGAKSRPVVLPEPPPARWVFEQALVEPSPVALPEGDWNANNLLSWMHAQRFLELTCAVCEVPGAGLAAATPSLTIARAQELSLEEKFQQGVGTNLELDAYLGEVLVRTIRNRFLAIARGLGVSGYSRIDAFYDQRADVLYVIEANTLCALTEATVYYSQLLGSFGCAPAQALEWIVQAGWKRHASSSAGRAATTLVPSSSERS